MAILKPLRERSLTGWGYLAVMATTIVMLAVAVIALAVVVDPYRMYGVQSIPGVTAMKPAAYHNSYFVKDYMLERAKPRTLLLGNSRVEIGLDPQSPLWPQADRPVFNAAEAGYDLTLAALRFRHALARAPLQLAVVAVDFPDFLTRWDLHQVGNIGGENSCPVPDRGGRSDQQPAIQRWKDRVVTTLTIDALIDSIATLANQNPTDSVTMDADGFNPLHQYAATARQEGYHALFAQKYAGYVAQFAAGPKLNFADPMRHANFRCLEAIVRAATSHGTRLIIFINPYHYTLLELWHEVGLWASFENWKRALVAVIDHAADRDRDLVTVLDFSGYSRFAMETVPPAGDRNDTMRWYWESGHYTSALGEKLIARMVGEDNGFGQELTAATIEHVLHDIAAGRPDITAALAR